MTRSNKTTGLFLGLLLAAAASASGQEGFFYERGTNDLYLLDLAKGSEVRIGSLGSVLGTVTQLGWRRDAQTLWAVTTAGEIGQIDTETGAYTARYQMGGSLVDLDWDPRREVFYIKTQTGSLRAFDPATGTDTTLGVFSPAGPYGTKFATDAHGMLWAYDDQVHHTLTQIDVTRRTYALLAAPDTDLIESLTIHDKTWAMYVTIGEQQPQQRTPGVYALSPTTGVTRLVHAFQRPSALPSLFELADLPDGYVHEMTTASNDLETIDFATNKRHVLRASARIGELAWRDDIQQLWCVQTWGDIGSIDRFSGRFTVYDTLPPGANYFGMAWDSAIQRFWLSELDAICQYDPATKKLTTIRQGTPQMWSLDMAPDGTLWGMGNAGVSYKINKNTGAATKHSVRFGSVQIDGIAFTPELGEMYGVAPDQGNEKGLYRCDLSTGTLTRLMTFSGGLGLEIVSMPSTGSFSRSGSGCRDSSGTEVRLLLTGEPDITRTMVASVLQGAGQPYLLAFGASNTSWGGFALPLRLSMFGGMSGCYIRTSLDVFLGPYPSFGALAIELPNEPSIVGLQAHCQALLLDSGLSGLGLATSDLLTMTVGR